MAPPSFSDLGRSSRTVFNQGYNFGFIKFDSSTRSGSNLEFRTGASHNTLNGKLFGTFELKYKLPDYGMVLTERWNTDNTLNAEICLQDKLPKGTKVTLDTHYSPTLGKRSGKIKADFSNDHVHLDTDVSLDLGGPMVNLGAVFGYKGWLLGYHVGVDSQRSKLTHQHMALGKEAGNATLHTYVHDGKEFGGSFYQRVNDKLEVGTSMGWTTGEQQTRFGLACKYLHTRDTTFRAKVSNSSQLALGLTHTLNSNLKLHLSTLFNLKDFNEGGHKYGVGIEFDA